jgi:hypothetical protein
MPDEMSINSFMLVPKLLSEQGEFAVLPQIPGWRSKTLENIAPHHLLNQPLPLR